MISYCSRKFFMNYLKFFLTFCLLTAFLSASKSTQYSSLTDCHLKSVSAATSYLYDSKF